MAADEELLAGPRLPRWLVPAVGLLVAVLVLGLGAVRLVRSGADPTVPTSSSASTPVAQPPPPVRTSALPEDPTVGPFEPGTLGPDVARVFAPVSGPVSDVVTDGESTWYASGPYIVMVRGHESAIGGPGTGPGGLRLAVDRSQRLLWSYVPGRSGATLAAFSTRDLRPLATFGWPRPIDSAVALDGWLYVSDPEGVWAVHPNGLMPTSPLLYGVQVHALAADPLRHRVLLLIDDNGLRFATMVISPSISFFAAPPGLKSGSLAVTRSGAIWLAGVGGNGAILDRLDPRTLGVAGFGNVVAQLGPSASSLAAGDDTVVVGGESGQLWCVGGTDGATLQRWAIAGNRTAMATGTAFATQDNRLYRLRLKNGCTG